jgi:hypothetical protein
MEDTFTKNINEIGFADSEIISYTTKHDIVTLFVKLSNAEIFEIKFINYVSLLDMCYFRIADIRETFESPLLDRVLEEYYEIKPVKHPFRIFKVFNSDDMTALEIVCEDVNIRRIKKSVPYNIDLP